MSKELHTGNNKKFEDLSTTMLQTNICVQVVQSLVKKHTARVNDVKEKIKKVSKYLSDVLLHKLFYSREK